jgi:hypothetical protein
MDSKTRSAHTAALAAYPLPPRLAAILEGLPLERLAFAPMPVKPRRDGWSPARQYGFIQRLALCGDVAASARGVGMSRESAWRRRARPGAEGFAAAWDEAAGWGADRLSDLGMERCLAGERRGIFYRGRKVGEERRFDNRLLIAMMNRFPAPEAPLPPGEDAVTRFNRLLDELAPDPSLKTKDFLRDSA